MRITGTSQWDITMRQIRIKGKPFEYQVGAKTTRIKCKSSSWVVPNDLISNNGEVTPGKLTNYVVKEILATVS